MARTFAPACSVYVYTWLRGRRDATADEVRVSLSSREPVEVVDDPGSITTGTATFIGLSPYGAFLERAQLDF